MLLDEPVKMSIVRLTQSIIIWHLDYNTVKSKHKIFNVRYYCINGHIAAKPTEVVYEYK